MKKQFLLFAAAALILTSCGNENTENQGQTQAQIDSAVNAQVAEREAEMARKNDSTLKAMEAEKAAAEAAAAEEAAKKSSGKKTTKTTKAEPATPPPPPPPPPPANPKEDRFKDQKDKTTDPSAPNKKADRFK